MKSLTTEKIITRFKNIHNDKYDYSLVNYTRAKDKVNIICREHGLFKQTPDKHYQGKGCRDCQYVSMSKKFSKNLSQFILESNIIHDNYYDYSLVNYINTMTKIKIICKYHGEFEQTPNKHLSGQGCSYCGHMRSGICSIDYLKNNSDFANKETNLYFLKFYNDKEEFYKVGISNNLDLRFSGNYSGGYNIEIIDIKKMTVLEARIEEDNFKLNFSKFKYNPIVKFGGHTECFSKDIYNVMFPKK